MSTPPSYVIQQLGYRHIDCASFYKNEKLVGDALRESGVPREELFVTGKVWNDYQGYDRTIESFERSLADLQVGYFDLFLVHWPVPEVHVETYRALQEMQRQGKTRAIGLSNYTMEDFQLLQEKLDLSGPGMMPVCNQVEVNPFLHRKDTIDFFQSKGVAIVAYKPLKAGAATSNEAVEALAKKHGRSAAQVLLRWGVQHGYSVLPKSSNPERMAQNIALFDFALDPEDMAALDALMTDDAMKGWREHYDSRRGQDYPPKE